jgi:hypothetical protein
MRRADGSILMRQCPIRSGTFLDEAIRFSSRLSRDIGPRNVFHTYRNVGDTELKMLIVYTPAGFEQSFVDAAAMLEEGKDQGELGHMLLERYGLTRGQLPAYHK